MGRTLGVRMAVLTVAVASIGGCTAEESGSASPTVAPTSEVTVETAATTPLYETFEAQRSVGPNGQPIRATLAGADYPDSTGMWVGCEGEPATTTYRLDRDFSEMQAVAGLQPHTPDQLAVSVQVTGDGRILQQFVVTKAIPVPVELAVNSVETLVVAATAVDRSLCDASETPYGALGGATLTVSAP